MRRSIRSLVLVAAFLGPVGLTLPGSPTPQQPAPRPGGDKQPPAPLAQPSGYVNPKTTAYPGGYQQYPGGYQPYPGGYQPYPGGGYQQYPGGYSQPFNPYLPPPPVPTTEVAVYDGYFYPKSIQVAPGAKVRWTNKGQQTHTVREYRGSWGSPEMAPGDSWSVTLRRPLNYYYYCRQNRLSMQGTIVVK